MKVLLIVPAAVVALVVSAVLVLGGHEAAAVVPGPPTCTAPTSTPAAPRQPGDTFGGITLSPEKVDTVQKILGTAKGRRITKRGATVAIQTAYQESKLDPHNDKGRALGTFQQIAPGPYEAYTGYDPHDTAAAAGGFFTVLMKRVPGYDADPRTNHDLAQEVQRSGAGAQEYAQWQTFAEAITNALYDGSGPPLRCTDQSAKGKIAVTIRGNEVTLPPEAGVSGQIIAPTPQTAKAIGSGLAWLGTPYAWGGGNADGPTKGISDNGGAADKHGDTSKIGFDCAGLTAYAYAQAGVKLTRPSRTQLTNAKHVVQFSLAEPGDLLFWGTHHVAMYLGQFEGQHQMLEAPQSGDVVKVSKVRTGGDFRGVAARPIPGR
ncbi:C40 family peptidase [Amycolatopsis sp. WAC 01375]|uniref:C40 family peptidase n=1 Tax=Amycolatopsis sp. WAC 01375 TaxID=2203194 RepID=UPI0018F793FE|nr:C40 family peptidase [Amycolatopsis sp. WAC 01375]